MWSDLNDRLDRLGAIEQERLALDERRLALETARFRLVKMQDGRLRELLALTMPYVKRVLDPKPTYAPGTVGSLMAELHIRPRSKRKGSRK